MHEAITRADRIIGWTIIAAMLFFATATVASAELRDGPYGGRCGPLPEVEHLLTQAYQEKLVGMAGQPPFVALYVSEKGSWTIIETDETGDTCIVRSGVDWFTLHFGPFA